MKRLLIVGAVALVASACVKRVHEQPIIENGDRVGEPVAAVETARDHAVRDNAAAAERRDELAARALADCVGAVCEGVARGEVVLGMSEAQVLAATRTTEGAWNVRHAGGAGVMVPRTAELAPRDAAGQIAMVQLRNGRVGAVSYREAEGVRLVSNPADATTEGRARARAETLVREGDDFAARGDLNAALDRYDRAQILSGGDAMIDYRIASVLDKQLRPIEALIRYQLFLHRLEIEKIEARGDAYAKLADAIARARERIIVLEKHSR